MSTKYSIRGYILQDNNPNPGSLSVSSSDQIVEHLYKTYKYPIIHDQITPHLLLKIRIPKKMPMPELKFGTEYQLTIKALPYKFTQNSITRSGYSFMLVSISEYYAL